LDGASQDHPVLIVAEGVTMYLTQDIIKALLNRLTDHFPSGQLAFDVHTPQLVWLLTKTRANVRGTGATFGWGIDELLAHDLAVYAQMPGSMRALVRVMDAIPALRVMRCLLYRFERR
jgi:O-methyltransferase involved in polyketide biosynthesis